MVMLARNEMEAVDIWIVAIVWKGSTPDGDGDGDDDEADGVEEFSNCLMMKLCVWCVT